MPSTASLKVSKCNRFAILHNSIGDYFVVWSKTYARFMVNSGVVCEVITEDDAKNLFLQITSSFLPDEDVQVGNEVKVAIAKLNMTHVQNSRYKIDEDMITKAIDLLELRSKTKLN